MGFPARAFAGAPDLGISFRTESVGRRNDTANACRIVTAPLAETACRRIKASLRLYVTLCMKCVPSGPPCAHRLSLIVRLSWHGLRGDGYTAP
jgi:hypothetical protein